MYSICIVCIVFLVFPYPSSITRLGVSKFLDPYNTDFFCKKDRNKDPSYQIYFNIWFALDLEI